MQKCKQCGREKPDYTTDMTCAKGGYCEWDSPSTPVIVSQQDLAARIIRLGSSKVIRMDVSWAGGNGTPGRNMHWAFPQHAIVEGLEVEPHYTNVNGVKPPYNASYHGFIDDIRVGMESFLRISPYPILMWSPGMPQVDLWLPEVPYGTHFSLVTREFHGRIRPRGYILKP